MKSSSAYFDALGWRALPRQPVELQQSGLQGCNAVGSCKRLLRPRLVRRTFGGCTHQVLASWHAHARLGLGAGPHPHAHPHPHPHAHPHPHPYPHPHPHQVLAFDTLFSTISLTSNWSYCITQVTVPP